MQLINSCIDHYENMIIHIRESGRNEQGIQQLRLECEEWKAKLNDLKKRAKQFYMIREGIWSEDQNQHKQ